VIGLFSVLEVRRRIVRFLHLKKKALFSAHGAPDYYQRHLLAFESHDSAPMGELRFPGDIIMVTLVAGDGHGAGYWFLATGCWLRVVCYGLRGE